MNTIVKNEVMLPEFVSQLIRIAKSDVYLKLSEEEYQRLLQTKRDEYISNTRKSGDHYIVKCSEANKDEVVRLIRTVKHSMPMT